MSGPNKSSARGIAIPIDLDLDNPFGGAKRTFEGESEATGEFSEEVQSQRRAALPANLAAKDLGFASEADRIAKVSKIINAFGSTRRKAPRVIAKGATGAGKGLV